MYYTVDGAVVPLSKPVNWYPKPANGSEPGRGTINNDSFNSQAGETMFGSLGDDTYNLWQNSAAVIEKFAEGVDTIYGRYWGGVILPDNVENLLLISGGANFGFGNNLGNLIVAGNAGAKLDGRAGNDVLVGGEGDDVFVVAKGNGSDAIINFTPGRDTILLQGQGYAEWSDLTARMHQTGADVTLHTSIEEDVIIRGIALADLDAADFGMLLPNKASPAQAGLLNGAQKSAYDNGWYVLNNAWGAKAFVEGDDYNINTIFDPKDLTAGTTFNWRFPVSDPGEPMKVLAYPEIIFGVSPHGDQSSNRTVVLPIQLEDLASFRVDYDVDYNGSNGFNVAFDIWFTSEPYGDASKITNEVMIWVHKGDFDPYGDVIGTYSKDGFTAKIYHQGTYTAVVADGDLLTANIDVADIIGVLSELGVISSSEYLASIELGAEVSGGAGSLTVKNLDLTVEERAPAGGILTHKVSGAGVETLYEPDLDVPAGAEPAVDWQAVYAADGTISGYLGVERQNEGTTLTTHYAVDHHITGSTLTRVKPDGAVLTIEYDAAGAEAGSKLVVARGNDVTRTYHYDKTGELTGSVVHDPHASDGSRNVSYDSSGKFVSCEVTSLSGSITMVTHYDADWKASSRMMSGSSSDDAIYGGKSINVMRGGAGNDTLVGNENADVLIGGLGTDHLRGAGGADRFVFEQMKEMGAKSDTADLIADFNASEGDLIDLTGIDANLLLAGHQSFAFVGTKPIAPRAGS
jgi:Ca2+-binding RTX toxin-like protein